MTINSSILSNNEFVCDCHLADLVHYLRLNGSRLQGDANCFNPKHLKGRAINSLNKDELHCKGSIITINTNVNYHNL